MSKNYIKSIFETIKAYHERDPYDGDSWIYSDDKNMISQLKELILNENPFGWTLWEETENVFSFSDMSNENCILTTNKEIFGQAPLWAGLKIIIGPVPDKI